MTRRKWIFIGSAATVVAASRLSMELWKGTSMRMTAVEKLFVNSPGHAAQAAGDAERLLDRIQIQPGWRYLDVGCGVGSAARRVAETRRLEVTGVDIDPEQIKSANAAAELPNLRYQVMDATRLEFGAGEFDIVATSKTTHHIPNYEDALREMARVLRPGGYLIYSDMTVPRWLAAVGKAVLPVVGYPSQDTLDSFAAEAGLKVIHRSRSIVQLDTIWQKQ